MLVHIRNFFVRFFGRLRYEGKYGYTFSPGPSERFVRRINYNSTGPGVVEIQLNGRIYFVPIDDFNSSTNPMRFCIRLASNKLWSDGVSAHEEAFWLCASMQSQPTVYGPLFRALATIRDDERERIRTAAVDSMLDRCLDRHVQALDQLRGVSVNFWRLHLHAQNMLQAWRSPGSLRQKALEGLMATHLDVGGRKPTVH